VLADRGISRATLGPRDLGGDPMTGSGDVLDDAVPTVSVVVPTFNRRDQLHRTLLGLAEQQLPGRRFETIVISDGSTDGTTEYLRGGETPLPVVALTQENAGPAAARNRGVEAARGDLIVFVDDDIVPAPGLIAAHLAAHETLGDELISIGPMLTPPDGGLSPWVSWEQRMLEKQYDMVRSGVLEISARQFYTANAAVRRSHLIAAGGFDETFRRAEDVELAYRLADRGLTFAFVEDAVGYHYAERSYASWRANAYVYGRNDIIFGRDRGQSWMFALIKEQFDSRHPIVRALTHISVPRPRLHRAVDRTLSVVAGVARRARLDAVEQYALSAIYNLAYYEGVAVELGSGDRLKELLGI
jgi:GT2 family glycosyltransferase